MNNIYFLDSFAGELHFVHYSARFNNVTEAVESGESDALAVLGVMLRRGSETRPGDRDEPDTGPPVKVLKTEQQKVYIAPFPLRNLVPQKVGDFYRYNGSLTTPNCQEVVVWTVLSNFVFYRQTEVTVRVLLVVCLKIHERVTGQLSRVQDK